MKLILSLTLIWALSSTAGALQCQTCTTLDCSSTVTQTCSSETACITASIQANIPSFPIQPLIKGCAASSLCPALGTQTFSSNFGFANAVVSAECCNKDNCNNNTLPFPAAQTNNGLACFTCDFLTSNCTSTVQCKGVENSCFRGIMTARSVPVLAFGCASANVCAAAKLGSLLNVFNATGSSCCGSSLCNTVKTTSAAGCRITLGMIHLLLGLLMFTLC